MRTRRAGLAAPSGITVVFDDRCSLCQRCKQWLGRQAQLVSISFAAASDPAIVEWMGDSLPVGDELVVVGDNGHVWIGPDAFITCLWALRDYRSLARRLQLPGFRAMAKQIFHGVSSGRGMISAAMGPPAGDSNCDSGACSPSHLSSPSVPPVR